MILYHSIEIDIAIYDLISSRLIYFFFVKSEIDCTYLDI